MDFGEAFKAMQAGMEVRREAWKGSCSLSASSGGLENGIILIFPGDGAEPWEPLLKDICADDWTSSGGPK